VACAGAHTAVSSTASCHTVFGVFTIVRSIEINSVEL
jgi:hypothetical protein